MRAMHSASGRPHVRGVSERIVAHRRRSLFFDSWMVTPFLRRLSANPRKWRLTGRATALFSSFSERRSFLSMNRRMLAMTRVPARLVRT